MILLVIILFSYWAVKKGQPLKWYELLALVIGYLLTVYPINILVLVNKHQVLYPLAIAMLSLGLIILIVDIWLILYKRKNTSTRL